MFLFVAKLFEKCNVDLVKFVPQ